MIVFALSVSSKRGPRSAPFWLSVIIAGVVWLKLATSRPNRTRGTWRTTPRRTGTPRPVSPARRGLNVPDTRASSCWARWCDCGTTSD